MSETATCRRGHDFVRPTGSDYECPVCELTRLEAEFEASGGRGVDIAERIDALRESLAVQAEEERDERETMPGEDGYDDISYKVEGDDGDDEPRMCCMCGGPLIFMGGLGRRTWFRCRDCGNEESFLVETKPHVDNEGNEVSQ